VTIMECPNCQEKLADGACQACGWTGPPPEIELDLQAIDARFSVTGSVRNTVAGSFAMDGLSEDGNPVTVKVGRIGTPGADALRREFDALTQLDGNPRFPKVEHYGESGGLVQFILSAPAGRPLTAAWSNASESQRLDWLSQVCDALVALHDLGYVHLALTPESISVGPTGDVFMSDLGLCLKLPIADDAHLRAPRWYGAPELLLSPGEVKAQADIYSLGATWYSLLIGEPLGEAHFEAGLMAKQPADILPTVHPAVNGTVAKAMQRLPSGRQRSLLALKDAVEEIKRSLAIRLPAGLGISTDIGLARSANEDSFDYREFLVCADGRLARCGLYLVSDGMGGETGGRVASRMTVDVALTACLPTLTSLSPAEANDDLSDRLESLLGEAINKASQGVYERGRSDPLLRHMGATVVLAILLGRHAYIANVGDSRAYLVSTGAIEQLTTDHTLVGQLVSSGQLDPREAADHPAQGQLTRNIGGKPQVEPSFVHRELGEDDLILLCSDGLTAVLEDERIQDTVLAAESLQAACNRLVNLANGLGGPDNITALLVRVGRHEVPEV